MKKYAYLARLEELLEALPAEERQDALNYYEEFFDAAGVDDSAAAGLESPEQAARKILEGEGVAPSQPVPPTPPAAPEPPPLDEPQSYPTSGTTPRQPPKPFSRRGWILFLVVLLIAFLVQLAVLVLNLVPIGGSADMATASSATTEAITEYVTGDAANLAQSTAVTPELAELPATGTGYAQNMVCSMKRGDSLGIKLRSGKVFLEVNEDINDRSTYIGVRNADKSFAVQQIEDGDWLVGSTDRSGALILTVKIPRVMLLEVQVSLEKGDISVMDNLSLEELELETGSGRITTQNVSAEDVELKTSDGHVATGVVTPQEKLKVVAAGGATQLILAGTKSDYSLYVVSKNGVLRDGGEQTPGRSLKTSQSNRPTVTVQADGNITLEYSGG